MWSGDRESLKFPRFIQRDARDMDVEINPWSALVKEVQSNRLVA
jgi:hypothetical protein